MASSVEELNGINRALDRLETRTKSYHAYLWDTTRGLHTENEAQGVAISIDELQLIETLVRRFALRVLGTDPDKTEWPSHDGYYEERERELKRSGSWAQRAHTGVGWTLRWLSKTRLYVEYLGGLQSAQGYAPQVAMAPAETKVHLEGPRYDVALSYAGEDRAHARKIAELLRAGGHTVFYDEYEQATLWGRNLYTHLSDVYQNKARYCLMFISSNYARKLWTKREREAAQARAFRESQEYILPLRLDDTVLPGIEETVGYIDLRQTLHDEVAQLLSQKLRQGASDGR